jgi:hypothetical protein
MVVVVLADVDLDPVDLAAEGIVRAVARADLAGLRTT